MLCGRGDPGRGFSLNADAPGRLLGVLAGQCCENGSIDEGSGKDFLGIIIFKRCNVRNVAGRVALWDFLLF